MKKRNFKTQRIQDLDVKQLLGAWKADRVVVGVDIAKHDQFAVLLDGHEIKSVLRWQHPAQTSAFVELCRKLGSSTRSVEVALESTGTYGDPIRFRLYKAGIPVYRVGTKRVHDAAEVFDGVPSLHDRKAAWLVARLHADGLSEEWRETSESKRELKALTKMAFRHERRLQRVRGEIEAELARHWPELTQHMAISRATVLAVLKEYGSPQAVVSHRAEVAALMRRVGRTYLKDAVIQDVLDSAEGQPQRMTPAEVDYLKDLADEADRARRRARKSVKSLREVMTAQGAPQTLMDVAGPLLAAALLAGGQDPRELPNAASLQKAVGLNLREHSSGTKQGGLHITKRGPGKLRQLIYMFALRMIATDPIVRAWYQRKVERQGGEAKMKAVVAVMRKLIRALWYVGRGAAFDASKLFDTSRLQLSRSAA